MLGLGRSDDDHGQQWRLSLRFDAEILIRAKVSTNHLGLILFPEWFVFQLKHIGISKLGATLALAEGLDCARRIESEIECDYNLLDRLSLKTRIGDIEGIAVALFQTGGHQATPIQRVLANPELGPIKASLLRRLLISNYNPYPFGDGWFASSGAS